MQLSNKCWAALCHKSCEVCSVVLFFVRKSELSVAAILGRISLPLHEKYLVFGVFGEAGSPSSSFAVGEQPGYCLLTASGRKVLTLLQAIVEDMSPLVALQMGSLVIGGLMNLFTEYTIILEGVLTYETSATEPEEEDNKVFDVEGHGLRNLPKEKLLGALGASFNVHGTVVIKVSKKELVE
ncbi:exocyst complex component EXO84B-like isoform X1 [Sesbania bispinosa]|nr:exocyst complex component EXO84B-like isoform X1 [Sesbania bispinosa]